eukprot:TRINITY_DN19436_c0_g1_i1.p1 TRINITY_DN19436_c0_g1~~TRINITY_DN19436_c0_g1_i1.p1  ORF type:complete len:1176 (+),score=161.20 TRINITY_DN19436_c0_g1_i1:83-3610(+)
MEAAERAAIRARRRRCPVTEQVLREAAEGRRLHNEQRRRERAGVILPQINTVVEASGGGDEKSPTRLLDFRPLWASPADRSEPAAAEAELDSLTPRPPRPAPPESQGPPLFNNSIGSVSADGHGSALCKKSDGLMQQVDIQREQRLRQVQKMRKVHAMGFAQELKPQFAPMRVATPPAARTARGTAGGRRHRQHGDRGGASTGRRRQVPLTSAAPHGGTGAAARPGSPAGDDPASPAGRRQQALQEAAAAAVRAAFNAGTPADTGRRLRQYVDVSGLRLLRCKFGGGRRQRSAGSDLGSPEGSDWSEVPSPFASRRALVPDEGLFAITSRTADSYSLDAIRERTRSERSQRRRKQLSPHPPGRSPARRSTMPQSTKGSPELRSDTLRTSLMAGADDDAGEQPMAKRCTLPSVDGGPLRRSEPAGAKDPLFALTEVSPAAAPAIAPIHTPPTCPSLPTRPSVPSGLGTKEPPCEQRDSPRSVPSPRFAVPNNMSMGGLEVPHLELSKLAAQIHESEWDSARGHMSSRSGAAQSRSGAASTGGSAAAAAAGPAQGRARGGQFALHYRCSAVVPPSLPPPPAVGSSAAAGDRRRAFASAQVRTWEHQLHAGMMEELDRCERRRALFFTQKFEVLDKLSTEGSVGNTNWAPVATRLRGVIEDQAARRDASQRSARRHEFLSVLASAVQEQPEDCYMLAHRLNEIVGSSLQGNAAQQGAVGLTQEGFSQLLAEFPPSRLLQDPLHALLSHVRPLFGVSDQQWRQALRERLRPLDRGEPALMSSQLDAQLRKGPQLLRVTHSQRELLAALADQGMQWHQSMDHWLGQEVAVIDEPAPEQVLVCLHSDGAVGSETLRLPIAACTLVADDERRRRGPRAPPVPPRLRMRGLALRGIAGLQCTPKPQLYVSIRCDCVAPRSQRPTGAVVLGRDALPTDEEYQAEQHTSVRKGPRPVWNEPLTWCLADEREAVFDFVLFDVANLVGRAELCKPAGYGTLSLRDLRLSKGVRSKHIVRLHSMSAVQDGGEEHTHGSSGTQSEELCVVLEPLNFGQETGLLAAQTARLAKSKHELDARQRASQMQRPVSQGQLGQESPGASRNGSRLSGFMVSRHTSGAGGGSAASPPGASSPRSGGAQGAPPSGGLPQAAQPRAAAAAASQPLSAAEGAARAQPAPPRLLVQRVGS